MTARQPRDIAFADIEQAFELCSYWFGAKWCPAVARTGHGFGIRVLRSQTVSLSSQQISYDYFEIDETGLITTAPRGQAKDWKPGRVVDIEAAADWFAEPRADAMQLNIGGVR